MNNNLAKAVAWLLPHKHKRFIKEALANEGKDCVYLAFECHKALRALEEVEFSCSIDHSARNDGMTVYAYGLEKVICKGLGDTDEEAIFNAVLNWWENNSEQA